MKILEDIKLDIPGDTGKDFLTKLMGGMLNPTMEQLLSEKREVCVENMTAKAVYDTFEISKVQGDFVYFNSGAVFEGPNISKILKGSSEAAIFICTLGEKIDRIIKEVSDGGDSLSVIIMDAITTDMLGLLSEYMGNFLRQEGIKNPGWASTCSYSPGQYKWTIEEQKVIFSMVDGASIGVELNQSYLMVPFKTLSGTYGFGPEETIDKTRVACDLCPRQNCIGRH